MATRQADDVRNDRVARVPARTSLDETKASFQTTELWVFVAAVIGVLYAASEANNFDADQAWTLVAALTIGYMLSRGLAKAGSRHADDNY